MSRIRSMSIVPLLVAAAGCSASSDENSPAGEGPAESTATVMSFEQFEAITYREPWENGVYIVNGDTPVANVKQLREFYEAHVASEQRLIVQRYGSSDAKWSESQKRNLTYCVSDAFSSRKAQMVAAMDAATAAWEQAADVDFIHATSQDSSCTASNGSVVFDVRPVSGQQYLARAFFPGQSRATRNVLVDSSSFSSSISLTGILRHELGHALGFRHEHTRPEAGQCFEDNNWRELTPYDRSSVMHYPQCGGNNYQLALSSDDVTGARALYGAPGSEPPPPPPSGDARTETFSGSLARGEQIVYGPFEVIGGSELDAVISGTGDADLYVRFDGEPTTSAWDCRPYLNGSSERCTLDVPGNVSNAYVMVRGYASATFSLTVNYSAPTTAPPPEEPPPEEPPPQQPTRRTGSASGSVSRGQRTNYQPLSVVPGTTLDVAISGSGDADLYVRFGSAPTLSAYDCRPYVNGSSESCSLTVPQGESEAHIMVYGYAAASYQLDVTWFEP